MIRERIQSGMEASRREELNDLNRSIHDAEEHVKRIQRDIVRMKSSKNDLLRIINDGVTDQQIADVLTAVAVGQGVIDDAAPGWREDRPIHSGLDDGEFDSNGTA